MKSDKLTLSVTSCSRCRDDHDDLEFEELTYPVEDGESGEDVLYTHWASCPTNDEPILLRVRPLHLELSP